MQTTCEACLEDCAPVDSGTTRVELLGPGQSVDLTWDARGMTVITESVLCDNGFEEDNYYPVYRPVPAGMYRVRTGAFLTLPPECDADGTCYPPVSTTPGIVTDARLCDSDAVTSTDFEIPEVGDVLVDIDAP
jgi:hypothetical protein